MYAPIPTSLTAFVIPDEDTLHGSVLTPMQEAVMRNRLAALSEERLAREIDADKIHQSLQADAYLHGQISMIQLLLEESEVAKTAVDNPEPSA